MLYYKYCINCFWHYCAWSVLLNPCVSLLMRECMFASVYAFTCLCGCMCVRKGSKYTTRVRLFSHWRPLMINEALHFPVNTAPGSRDWRESRGNFQRPISEIVSRKVLHQLRGRYEVLRREKTLSEFLTEERERASKEGYRRRSKPPFSLLFSSLFCSLPSSHLHLHLPPSPSTSISAPPPPLPPLPSHSTTFSFFSSSSLFIMPLIAYCAILPNRKEPRPPLTHAWQSEPMRQRKSCESWSLSFSFWFCCCRCLFFGF